LTVRISAFEELDLSIQIDASKNARSVGDLGDYCISRGSGGLRQSPPHLRTRGDPRTSAGSRNRGSFRSVYICAVSL